jgi:hypothetical protein
MYYCQFDGLAFLLTGRSSLLLTGFLSSSSVQSFLSIQSHVKSFRIPGNTWRFYRFLKVWCFAESSMERDHFMSPEEAKSFGLVDEVIERRPEALVADSMAIKR